MDWYSWLSKSGLEPSLIYDYSLLFAENELEEDDIPHFDHEFLKSMGISVAKHRLEILKLAKRKPKGRSRPGLLAAVAGTKKRLSRYFSSLFSVRCDSSSAIVVVPKKPTAAAGNGPHWRGAMLKRGRKGAVRLLIAGPKSNSVSHSASPMVYRSQDRDEEIRWDSMFQNLKPT